MTKFEFCFQLRLVTLAIWLPWVNAIVSVTVGNRTFTHESMPGWIGQAWEPPEIDHIAHLQFFESNPLLCDEGAQEYVQPTDDVPVAILVSRGTCTFSEKGGNADRIDSMVQYVLVYNDIPQEPLVAMSGSSDEADHVGMLFISYEAGMELREVLQQQSQNVSDAGGMLVTMNGIAPPMQDGFFPFERTQRWLFGIMAALFSFITLLGCFFAAVQVGLIRNSRLATTLQNTAANVRSVLTNQQLQVLFEEERQTDNENVEQENAESSCAVCLEEFGSEGSGDVRTLPCSHQFHRECIVPWLTERHASCPLCKFDVLEHVRQASQEEPTSSSSPFRRGWKRIMRLGNRQQQQEDYVPAANSSVGNSSAASSPPPTGEDANELEDVVVEAVIPTEVVSDQP